MNNFCTLMRGDAFELLPKISGKYNIITDPPYAIVGGGASVAGKGVSEAFDLQFFRAWFASFMLAANDVLDDESCLWMTIDWRGAVAIEQALQRTSYKLAGVGVWDRGGLGMGYALRKTFENFVLIVGDKWKRNLQDEPDVWRHKWTPSNRKHGHQAEKPIELIARALRLCGNRPVLDPFMGSGTTGVVALNAGLHFVGIERDEAYFAIAERRIRDCDGYGMFA